ncbi:P-loop containing nucleoside triphosphate hydrolase protein [Coniophora puteana RWD-64-598 SS2]|uniref:DNA 3'-5' helicase n=1 Tax=Coniophora puteana (strain RWD-64-598) TaxID=741705 RepID=A0A5M3MF89_CONPW|nr:P-loop containing nucleoside triphosphate hydrolase protein [Coniophora puteana RWD-64-598 SS2]EIW77908.1 P-loop containing nucleoside triphosphate hydrolase protein [Coniophora puteana RWD-64-598 SS2]
MHVLYTIQGPLSETARESFDYLSFDFVEKLTLSEALLVHQAVAWFDFYTKGKGQLREFQLKSALKTLAGENVVVRAGTGYGKTMCMILPLILGNQSKIALTVSPLKLLQKNHVEDFNRAGIPSIQINEDTPNDRELWKKIEGGCYRNIFIAPEQFFRLTSGHVPRLAATMASNRKFLESIGFLFLDEAHFIVLSGFRQKGEKDAFRPAYARLGEVLPHLREGTPILLLSATLPPPILHTIFDNLHLDPSDTVQLMESINRPNHIYAVHRLYGGIKNLKNFDFLVPPEENPERPPKTVVFIDSRLSAARVAAYLRWRFPESIKSSKIVSHLHSVMSQDYINRVFSEFKTSDEIRVLVSTTVASNGIDVSDIARVVCVGASPTLEQMQQEFGRGGRNPAVETVCLALVEPWALSVEESAAPTNKEKRTDISVCEYMSSPTCRREYLRKRNADDSQQALKYTVSHCCDKHDDGFSLSSFFPGAFLHEEPTKPKKQSKATRDNRPTSQREPLRELIRTWRSKARLTTLFTRMMPTNFLLNKHEIDRIVKASPITFSCLSSLVAFLGETTEWETTFGQGLYNVIQVYDATVQAEIQAKKKTKKSAPRKQPRLKQEEPELDSIPPPAAYSQHCSEFQLKDEPWTQDPHTLGSQTFLQPGLSDSAPQDASTSQNLYPQITFDNPLIETMHVPATRPKRSGAPSQLAGPSKRAKKH